MVGAIIDLGRCLDLTTQTGLQEFQLAFHVYRVIEQPFGAKHHADFLAATGRRLDVVSPWHAWLQEQYYEDVRHHIVRKNNLGKDVIGNSRIKAQIPKFLAGETDLTA